MTYRAELTNELAASAYQRAFATVEAPANPDEHATALYGIGLVIASIRFAVTDVVASLVEQGVDVEVHEP